MTNPLPGFHLREILILDLHQAPDGPPVQPPSDRSTRSYLGQFGAMESTNCPWGQGRQSVEHILRILPAYSTKPYGAKSVPYYRRILNQTSVSPSRWWQQLLL